MYLSKIELNGFKSFAQRTILHFDPGITAIVGPNGCGKSNIVDAVRWVIGEQRARILRSEKMENVIFNGTSRRKPLGMADVQLTIENNRGVLPTEYSEVTLGRRLFRSGDSEYLLNGARCRLQDVTDLFMDTGMGAGAYSVIELKMIDEILSENAQDRRRLFEEAAGITRYKLRRRQALGKLDSTQADLTRLRDLTEEIDKQVRSLKRQAEKAARFKDYEERLRRLELTLAQLEYERLTGQIDGLDAEIALLQNQMDGLNEQLEAEEARLDGSRRLLAEREGDLQQRSQDLGQHLDLARRIETDLRLNHERLAAAHRDQQRIMQEQKDAAAQREYLVRTCQRTLRDLDEARPVLQGSEQVLSEARIASERLQSDAQSRRQVADELQKSLQQSQASRSEDQRKLDRLTSRVEFLEAEHNRLQVEMASCEAGMATLAPRHREAEANQSTGERDLERAMQSVQEARAQAAALEASLDHARRALRQTERARDAASAEVVLLESLVASYEEFSDAVQFLAASPGWAPNGLTTVSDVISCADEDRAAVDAALGEFGSCLVVQSEREVDAALSLLRSDEKGRATFIVIDRLNSFTIPTRSKIQHEHLHALLQRVHVTDARYKRLANILLGDCYVVASLDQARSVAPSNLPARYFTSAGEWLDSRGLLHGGGDGGGISPLANRLGRRDQLIAARHTLSLLESDLDRQTADVETIGREVAELSLASLEESVAERRTALGESEKLLARLSFELETSERRRRDMLGRMAAIARELDADRAEIAALVTSLNEKDDLLARQHVEFVAAREDYIRVDAEARSAVQAFNEAHVSSVQARNYVRNLEKDVERAELDIQVLDERADQQEAELAALADSIGDYEANSEEFRRALEGMQDERAAVQGRRDEAEALLAHTKAIISEIESRLRMIRQQRDQAVRDENQRAVRLAEATTRRSDLLEHIQEDFGVSLPEAPVPIEDDFDPGPAREEVHSLRERIRSLGAVNALALESYEEEAQRLEFLTAQRDDLEQAEKTLLDTITEINVTASMRFMETFQLISDNFAAIFGELFVDDASAYLELADPRDPLESPIEIVAKPRGKRPTGIAQLSGGEKTLTAIALLFAIYLVKPSPFCILDEVDAPLDDANVDRFMALIRRFSESTQFILVTHNKRTMELADRMYGVTMQEQGVSNLVSVRMEEAELAA